MTRKTRIQNLLDGWLHELQEVCAIPYDDRVSRYLAERLVDFNTKFDDWDVASLLNGKLVRVTGQQGSMIRYENVASAASSGVAMASEFSDHAQLVGILNRLQLEADSPKRQAATSPATARTAEELRLPPHRMAWRGMPISQSTTQFGQVAAAGH
jgi:hypothetical protein